MILKNKEKKTELIVYITLVLLFMITFVSKSYLNKLDLSLTKLGSGKIESLEISTNSEYISNSRPQKINIKFSPNNANISDLKWYTTTDEKDETLEIKENIVYGKNKGKTKVYLANNYIKSNEIEFTTVDFVNNIQVNNFQKVLPIKSEYKYDISILPETSLNNKVIIESSNNNILEVKDSENYIVYAKNKGRVKLSFKDTFNNVLFEDYVEVKWDRITSITTDEKEIILGKNQKYLANLTIEPEYALYNDLIFESSNDEIASVSTLGIITANNQGSVLITVRTEDNKVKTTFNLKVIEDNIKGSTSNASKDYIMLVNRHSNIQTGVINKGESFEVIKKISNTNFALVRNKDGIPGFIKIE